MSQSPKDWRALPAIYATAQAGDGEHSSYVDARPYLASMNCQQLIDMVSGSDFGDREGRKMVDLAFDGGCKSAAGMVFYVHSTKLGYDAWLHPGLALQWLSDHRPHLMAEAQVVNINCDETPGWARLPRLDAMSYTDNMAEASALALIDARPWLAMASRAAIQELIDHDGAYCPEAEDIVQYAAYYGCPAGQEILMRANTDDCCFYAEANIDDVIQWLSEHRPDLSLRSDGPGL